MLDNFQLKLYDAFGSQQREIGLMAIFTESEYPPAILVLADGTVFHGTAVGHYGQAVGELVFNTAMSGYQEILSDPSYADQMICFSYPHIGNVGTNDDDMESDRVYAAGAVFGHADVHLSNWRTTDGWLHFMRRHQVVGIADVDTRRLCRHLREHGAQAACIMSLACDERSAHQAACDFKSLAGKDLASAVTTSSVYQWDKPSHPLVRRTAMCEQPSPSTVVVVDFGVKQAILRLLVDRGATVTVVPATTPASDIIAMAPDGVLLSNGPGDPAANASFIQMVSTLIEANIKLFGICFGCQLLALALGGQTVKMKFGHHGANHPVQDLISGDVLISSQNHGFMIDSASLPDGVKVSHRSLFDGSVQGIIDQSGTLMGFQGHPEASPGPDDVMALFDVFFQSFIASDDQKALTASASCQNEPI